MMMEVAVRLETVFSQNRNEGIRFKKYSLIVRFISTIKKSLHTPTCMRRMEERRRGGEERAWDHH